MMRWKLFLNLAFKSYLRLTCKKKRPANRGWGSCCWQCCPFRCTRCRSCFHSHNLKAFKYINIMYTLCITFCNFSWCHSSSQYFKLCAISTKINHHFKLNNIAKWGPLKSIELRLFRSTIRCSCSNGKDKISCCNETFLRKGCNLAMGQVSWS